MFSVLARAPSQLDCRPVLRNLEWVSLNYSFIDPDGKCSGVQPANSASDVTSCSQRLIFSDDFRQRGASKLFRQRLHRPTLGFSLYGKTHNAQETYKNQFDNNGKRDVCTCCWKYVLCISCDAPFKNQTERLPFSLFEPNKHEYMRGRCAVFWQNTLLLFCR